MKTILLTATYIVGTGELLLAIYFWVTNSKNEIRRIVSLLAFVTGLWVLSIVFTTNFPPTHGSSVLIQATYFFGILLTTTLLHFAIVYPYRRFSFDRTHVLFLYIPVAIFAAILFASTTIVQRFEPTPGMFGRWVEGSMFPIYAVYLILLYLASLAILMSKISSADGINKKTLSTLVWSITIGGLPAIVLDLVIPLFTKYAVQPLVGTMSTVIWLGAMTYIVTKK